MSLLIRKIIVSDDCFTLSISFNLDRLFKSPTSDIVTSRGRWLRMNSADTIQFIASNHPSMHHRMTDITEKSRCAFLVVHSIISDPILLIQQIITIPGTV